MKRRRFLTVMGGVLVLSVGLVLANYGGGVTPVGAQGAPGNPTRPNPLNQVIDQLNQIMAALTTASGQNNHTLRWDTNNPSATRFVVLAAFANAAVLDKNTGLVWEQAPDTTGGPNSNGTDTWLNTIATCAIRNVGGTVGWRLPSVIELKSVQDPSLPGPFVPATIFTGVQSANYWSASTQADVPTNAWLVAFSGGGFILAGKASLGHAWCVRGGMNADQY